MSRRACMRAKLVPPVAMDVPGVRTFESGDVLALGGLMYRAYWNTVDYEGESPEQSTAEILKTIQGEYGAFMPTCSKVAARGGSILSATLITRFEEKPFVAFTFTDPDFSGRGLARACMQAAMSELFVQGERELHLVVTLANTPAVKLYNRLGFQAESG